MSVFVEFHLLQNFVPSLLNRDDTGAHKDALFGGRRRARISSQCLKRAMRQHWKNDNIIPEDDRAVRTKRLLQSLTEQLVALGRDATITPVKVQTALDGLGLQVDADGKSQYLLFLGADEVRALATAIDAHWDQLSDTAVSIEGKPKAKDKKKAGKDNCPPELVKALKQALSDTRSLEVRLFGRMLADLPEYSPDACCQVAHAIGTSALEREFDYYTAVDDLKPDDTSGADMIGQVEFASSCFYRYAVLDLSALHRQLGSDMALTERSLRVFANGMIAAIPSGKQNTFAAHQLPCHVAITLRKDAQPRSLANAFEKPIKISPNSARSLSGESAKSLDQYRGNLDSSYGANGQHWFHDLTDAELSGGLTSVADVVEQAVNDSLAALG